MTSLPLQETSPNERQCLKCPTMIPRRYVSDVCVSCTMRAHIAWRESYYAVMAEQRRKNAEEASKRMKALWKDPDFRASVRAGRKKKS